MKFSKPWSPPFNLKSVVLGKRAAKAGSQEQEEKQECRVKPQQLEQQTPVETKSKESSPRRCSYSSPRMSCDASQRHYFAQFKDALQTRQEEDEECRRYSRSPRAGAGGSGSGNNSPAVGRNVIARLMGLEDAAPCSPMVSTTTSAAAARTARSPRGVASPGSISKSPRQGPYKLVHTSAAADEKSLRASQEPSIQQNFLDDMEDHLRQCDRALERIEAVMQLKKRLLCKQQRIRTHRPATKFATSEESRCRRLEVERGHLPHASEYYHSPRSMSPRTPKADQQRSARFREAEEEEEGEQDCDYYYYSPRLHRPRPENERKQSSHNRSVSYGGETPIFSPPSYGYEEAARALRVSLADPPAMYLNKRPAMNTANSAKSTTGRPTVEEACGLSRSLSTRSRNELKPACVDVCNEQPSPVSVLESNGQDETSPASSDDYYYQDSERRCARAAETRRTAEPRRTRSKAVRALWAASAPPASAMAEKCKEEKAATTIEGLDLLTWSSDNESEVAEIALLLECLIFKRLVEETIWDMKGMHPKFGWRRTTNKRQN